MLGRPRAYLSVAVQYNARDTASDVVKEDYANLLSSIVCFFCIKRAGRFADLVSLRRESCESARGCIRNPLCGEDSLIYTSTTLVMVSKLEFPDLFDDGGAGNGLAFVAHQEFQQANSLGLRSML